MDPVNIRQEGDVSFTVLSQGPDSRSDFSPPRFEVGQTDDRSFRLYLDVESIQQVRFNAFTFSVYLASAKQPGAYKFQVTGNPRGSFRDAPVTVSFHVTSGSANLPGSIVMPVYNATTKDLLTVEKQNEPADVNLSRTLPLHIRLKNAADSLPVEITNVAVSEGCPPCWQNVSSPVNQKPMAVPSDGNEQQLDVDVTPSTVPAWLQGAVVLKPDVPHDTLSVTITYHSDPRGADKHQTIPVPVRFGPGPYGIALALFGGIALGLAAKYLLTGKVGKDQEKPVHAIMTALVFVIIAEAVGVLLTAYGSSKLVLFNLDIDPRQLLPAFILALLVSGGPAVVSSTKELFGKG